MYAPLKEGEFSKSNAVKNYLKPCYQKQQKICINNDVQKRNVNETITYFPKNDLKGCTEI